MKTPHRRSVLKTIGAGAVTFVAGVTPAVAHSGDDAMVRVAHASPDAPAVDVYVDAPPDDADPTIEGVEFADVTGYLGIPEGAHEVTITAAGTTEAVPPTPLSVELGDDPYTFGAIGELSPESEAGFTVDVYKDDLSPLDEETGRVRAYHAVPDAPPVDVRVVDGPTLASDLAFATESDNAEVPADTYPVAMYPAGADEPVLGPVDVAVREDQALTVFAMGNLEPEDGEPALRPVPAYADTAPFENGMAGDRGGGDTKVRVAHLSPDAPAVDVYVDAMPGESDPTVAGLSFTDVTGYLELPAGEYEVTITPADCDDPVPPTPIDLELRGEDYTVAAIGELSPEGDEPAFTVDVIEDKLGRLDDGTGRVRAYHAVPDAPEVDVRVVDGPTVASDLAFGEVGPNAEVPADTYPVAVYPAGADDPVLGPVDVEVRDGEGLTVFAAGNLDPEANEPEFQPVLAYEATAPFGQMNGGGMGDGGNSGNDDH
jgi:hypothetical protein